MSTTPRAVRTLDLPLGPGRQTLRLALASETKDEPAVLVLAVGFGGGDSGRPFHRPEWAGPSLTLPAALLPELRAALDHLDREEDLP